MNSTYEAIEQAARQLTIKQKAALAHTLLKDLDEGKDEDVHALWMEEARRRYDAYLRGEMDSSPSEDVIARVLIASVDEEPIRIGSGKKNSQMLRPSTKTRSRDWVRSLYLLFSTALIV